MHPKSFVSNFWGAVHHREAWLFRRRVWHPAIPTQLACLKSNANQWQRGYGRMPYPPILLNDNLACCAVRHANDVHTLLRSSKLCAVHCVASYLYGNSVCSGIVDGSL